MRGQILGLEGDRIILLGDDGARRACPIGEWRTAVPPQIGQWVDFVAEGEGAREAYLIPHLSGVPPHPGVQRTSSSMVLGMIGVGCLALSFIIPFAPTIAAFILGVIGASRAQEERDNTALLLSRISWIGALVLTFFGALLVMGVLALLGGLFGIGWHMATWPPIPT
jgi:hypothetical protein